VLKDVGEYRVPSRGVRKTATPDELAVTVKADSKGSGGACVGVVVLRDESARPVVSSGISATSYQRS